MDIRLDMRETFLDETSRLFKESGQTEEVEHENDLPAFLDGKEVIIHSAISKQHVPIIVIRERNSREKLLRRVPISKLSGDLLQHACANFYALFWEYCNEQANLEEQLVK